MSKLTIKNPRFWQRWIRVYEHIDGMRPYLIAKFLTYHDAAAFKRMLAQGKDEVTTNDR